jgi:hypothetical protein
MTIKIVANAVLFYVAWFGACLLAARGQGLLAALVPLAVVAAHFAMVADRGNAARLVAVAALIGLVGDTVVMTLGRSQFAAPGPLPGLAPAWAVALWMAFATLPGLALRWFRDRLALTAALSLVLGPLTYWSGSNMGAGSMGEPFWPHVAMLAVLWGLAAPLLLWLSRRWEAQAPPN